jgi:hypothetical protein
MTEEEAEAIVRARFPGVAPMHVWNIAPGTLIQITLGPDSVTGSTFEEALARLRPAPAAVPAPPKPDPRIAEMQKRIAELEAREPEVKIVEVEKIVERIVEVAAPAPEPDPEPETHFADLMLADETADDAKARLSQRLKELRHYLIAPEIRVNEDGSLGLTPAEQAELQDLERRQTLGRWLEA